MEIRKCVLISFQRFLEMNVHIHPLVHKKGLLLHVMSSNYEHQYGKSILAIRVVKIDFRCYFHLIHLILIMHINDGKDSCITKYPKYILTISNVLI